MKSIQEEVTDLLSKRAKGVFASALQAIKTAGAETLCNSVIGMSEEVAKVTCTSAGFKFRIISKDGKARIGSRDFKRDRIKVSISKGCVAQAKVG